jgi:hypothetical protein
MAKKVGKVDKKKGKFYYVDKQGYVVEADRSEMVKKKRSKSKRK